MTATMMTRSSRLRYPNSMTMIPTRHRRELIIPKSDYSPHRSSTTPAWHPSCSINVSFATASATRDSSFFLQSGFFFDRLTDSRIESPQRYRKRECFYTKINTKINTILNWIFNSACAHIQSIMLFPKLAYEYGSRSRNGKCHWFISE